MSGTMNVVMLMVMVVASMQLQGSKAQTSHTVGDSTGWRVPTPTTFYSTWASSQTFTAGDVLVFNFVTGNHNVAEVTRSDYDACNGTTPITMTANGPANITLPTAGSRYFICTVGPHCSLGQRLAINISAATGSPPAAQPATPPSATPAPVSPPSATPAPVSPPSATPAPVSPPSATPAPISPPPSSAPVSPPPSSTPVSPSPSSTPVSPSPSSTPDSPAGTTPAASSPDGGSGNAPPPPNSATSVAVTALPVALLSIALAFLY